MASSGLNKYIVPLDKYAKLLGFVTPVCIDHVAYEKVVQPDDTDETRAVKFYYLLTALRDLILASGGVYTQQPFIAQITADDESSLEYHFVAETLLSGMNPETLLISLEAQDDTV